jgi:heme/copper-type cytochrome/quinol oxidase subunit 2
MKFRTAKQWLWQFEYLDGSRTINDIHAREQAGEVYHDQEDVLHDFFVRTCASSTTSFPAIYPDLVTAYRARQAPFHLR